MAPYLQEQTASAGVETVNSKKPPTTKPLTYEPGRTIAETHDEYPYEHLLPTFPALKWEPLQQHPYTDKGLLGSPTFSSLLSTATSIQDLNPKIGTEVTGIDLASLTPAQKNDIARLIATRGVVFFRNQKNFDIQKQRELGQYFGVLHKHATTSVPRQKGLEDVHVVFADGSRGARNHVFAPSFLWHSDVSFFPLLFSHSCWLLDMERCEFTDREIGDLRTPTSVLHIAQTTLGAPQRRRRHNTLVIPIRRLRRLVAIYATLPISTLSRPLCRHASRRLHTRQQACTQRTRYNHPPTDPCESRHGLEVSVLQSRVCYQDCGRPETGV